MKSIVLIAVLMFSMQMMFAQEQKQFLYKGSIDKMPVTLFLIEEISGCPSISYIGMYKYDNLSNWLFLNISDNEKDKLVMVEENITGILSLKMKNEILEGFWISPDGQRKLKVKLKKIILNVKTRNELENILENINYSNHDC